MKTEINKMKILVPSNAILSSVLGEQQIKKESLYRKISFVELLNINNIYLAYNLFTGEFLQLCKNEYEVLQSNTFLGSNVAAYEIIKKWYAVPINSDEIKLFNQVSAIAKNFASNEFINSFTIFTTTECNARCFYCYEKGINQIGMDESTAHAVSNYIEKQSKGKNVFIKWFGGEPLCNSNVINIISEELKNRGIEYSSTMTTNGYLFDREIIENAVNLWKLKSVQITLDGTEKVYNRSKNYIYKNVNPFERVINNIDILAKNGIKVRIRLNMDHHNEDDLINLIDYLDKIYIDKSNIEIYVSLLFDYKKQRDIMDKLELTDKLLKIEKMIIQKGFFKKRLSQNQGFKAYYCMADNPHSTTITPNGNLGKCEHYAESDFWGSIYNDMIDTQVIDSWQERILVSNECRKCSIYPHCRAPKKCETFTHICDEADILLRKERVHFQMYNTYLDLLSKDSHVR